MQLANTLVVTGILTSTTMAQSQVTSACTMTLSVPAHFASLGTSGQCLFPSSTVTSTATVDCGECGSVAMQEFGGLGPVCRGVATVAGTLTAQTAVCSKDKDTGTEYVSATSTPSAFTTLGVPESTHISVSVASPPPAYGSAAAASTPSSFTTLGVPGTTHISIPVASPLSEYSSAASTPSAFTTLGVPGTTHISIPVASPLSGYGGTAAASTPSASTTLGVPETTHISIPVPSTPSSFTTLGVPGTTHISVSVASAPTGYGSAAATPTTSATSVTPVGSASTGGSLTSPATCTSYATATACGTEKDSTAGCSTAYTTTCLPAVPLPSFATSGTCIPHVEVFGGKVSTIEGCSGAGSKTATAIGY